MSIVESISLFGILLVLALMPSASVALVVTRSATLGVGNGVAVAAGIVLGDLLFIMLALLGLSLLAETMGGLFVAIRYLGALYLLWLGVSLLSKRDATTVRVNQRAERGSLVVSFLAGFGLTLGDIKAIYFYVSLLPTFVDLVALQTTDIAVIVAVTVVSVGGAKVFYALSATRVSAALRGTSFAGMARKTAGGVMIGAGGYLFVKA